MTEKERKQKVLELANEAGFDSSCIHLAHAIAAVMEPLIDKGTAIDSGGGSGSAELWPKIGGIEYYIQIRKSKAQLAKEESES